MLEWRLAWRNLWRHGRRTWLTVSAMVFCNVLLIFQVSLQFGMYQVMIDNTLRVMSGHIQLQAPGYHDEPRIRDTLDQLQPLTDQVRQQLPDAAVSARAMGFALVSSEQRSYGVQIMGVQPATEPTVSNLPGLVKEGRYLQADDDQAMVIGAALARNLKVSVGDELTLMGAGWDGSFAADLVTVVGIYHMGMRELERSLVHMPLTRFQESFSLAHRGHNVVVYLNDADRVEPVYRQLHNHFADGQGSPPNLQQNPQQKIAVLDWTQLQPGLQQAIQADMMGAWFIYGILVVLVAFSVMNTQLMSVLERTREFGIIMALGLRPGRLTRLVLTETFLMASVGLLISVALGATLVLVLGYTGFSYPGMDQLAEKFNLPARFYPSLSLFSLSVGPGAVFVASLLAALYPALRLHLLKPVTAMRAV